MNSHQSTQTDVTPRYWIVFLLLFFPLLNWIFGTTLVVRKVQVTWRKAKWNQLCIFCLVGCIWYVLSTYWLVYIVTSSAAVPVAMFVLFYSATIVLALIAFKHHDEW